MLYFRVFCEKLGGVDKKWWSSCFAVLGKVLEDVAETLTVSATCVMDSESGLLEYPVHGKLRFTQPVISCFSFVDLSGRLVI